MGSTTPPIRRLRAVAIAASAVAALAAGLVVATPPPPAAAATTTLAPASLTTTAGAIGAGQSAAALAVRDQSGTQDTWSKYVEFTGKYAGYRTYRLPTTVAPSAVTGLQVQANWRGPATATQTWRWSLWNWSTSTWTSVGTNAGAPSWGAWRSLSFASPANPAAHVSATREVRVRLAASNSADAANVDFEALTVTSADQQSGTGVVLPPAGGDWDYQIGGAYAPHPDVDIVVRDREATAGPVGGSVYDICYVNLMQTQPDILDGNGNPLPVAQQPYGSLSWWEANHPDLLLRNAAGELVGDIQWREGIFDVRTAAKRAALFEIQKPWISGCRTAGFDAVEPDNLDVHYRAEGLIDFETQTKAYLSLVIPFTHAQGLAIGQKNTTEFGPTGRTFVTSVTPAQGFDFAIAEECERWNECGDYTSVYGGRVYEVEYTDENVDPDTGENIFQRACAARGATNGIILRDRDVVPSGSAGYVNERC